MRCADQVHHLETSLAIFAATPSTRNRKTRAVFMTAICTA